MARDISNSADILDSRDIIARIRDLEGTLEDQFNEDNTSSLDCEDCNGTGTVSCAVDPNEDGSPMQDEDCDTCDGTGETEVIGGQTFEDWLTNQAENGGDEDAQELIALRALAEEADGASDWAHGEALIRDSYFEDYARDLHEDINGRDAGKGWPFDCIDWEEAADALKQDYSSVDYDGVTYWIRS
jgi:hypothetical protein